MIFFFDFFLDYNGLKKGNLLDPVQYYYLHDAGCGSCINVVEEIGIVTYKSSIRPHKKFREISLSNGFCKSIYKVEDNKLIFEQNGRRKLKITREFFRTHLVVTYSVYNTAGKKFYVVDESCY